MAQFSLRGGRNPVNVGFDDLPPTPALVQPGTASRAGSLNRDDDMTKRFWGYVIAITFGLALAIWVPPASATLYNWTLTGADNGSGTVTTGAADNGGFDIVGMTGAIDGFPISGLLGGQPGPGGGVSPSG